MKSNAQDGIFEHAPLNDDIQKIIDYIESLECEIEWVQLKPCVAFDITLEKTKSTEVLDNAIIALLHYLPSPTTLYEIQKELPYELSELTLSYALTRLYRSGRIVCDIANEVHLICLPSQLN